MRETNNFCGFNGDKNFKKSFVKAINMANIYRNKKVKIIFFKM